MSSAGAQPKAKRHTVKSLRNQVERLLATQQSSNAALKDAIVVSFEMLFMALMHPLIHHPIIRISVHPITFN
jgi:hypothetical protein